jgi:predicted ATPase
MITRIHIRNFKSLRDVEIRLSPLNVLAGPNMSGKSNIIDVLRFVQEMIFPQAGTIGIHYALAQRGGIDEVLWKGGDESLLTILIEGTDYAKPNYQFTYELKLLTGIGGFVSIQDESLNVLRDGSLAKLIQRQQGATSLMNVDGKQVGGVPVDGSSLQYAPPNWDGYSFSQWIKLWRFYNFVALSMKQPSSMALGQVLSSAGDNLSSWLMWLQAHSIQSFIRVNEVLHDLFPDVEQIRMIPTPDGKVHLASAERGLKRLTNVWQLSDGFLIMTALLSLIYVPPELSGTQFCVEEPENHLHPRMLETLVSLLRQVRQEAKDKQLPLTQLFITTQSPYLLDQFSIDEIVWVSKRNGETKASRPADKKDLRQLVENKELGLGELMYSGILGEGA